MARMSDTEGLMWTLEKDPSLRSDFLNVTLLDAAPDPDRLRAKVELAVERLPRLRQRVVTSPLRLAPPEWVDDTRFDLDYHVRRVAVAPPGDLAQLLDVAADVLMSPFDRARPLWEFTIVEGLPEGRAALLQKLHHTIIDGVGGLKLSLELLDFEREPAATATPEGWTPAERSTGPVDVLVRTAVEATRRNAVLAARLARQPLRLAGAARSIREQVFVTGGPLSPLMRDRSLSRRLAVHTISLDDAKAVGKDTGATVNDVFVTGVTAALGAYHRAMGSPAAELRMAMPVNLRGQGGDDSETGNQFAPVRVVVPAEPTDPRALLPTIAERLADVRAEPALGLSGSLAGILGLLPTALLVPISRAQVRTVDFATSNLRGSPVPLYLAGSRIEANHPMGPLTGAALNVTTLSYAGQMDLGVNLDPAAITDPKRFEACLVESFATLLGTDR
ncbi:MAG TPA: wax ester/triacylglycerol synthase family O-acyltransferase [Acidimicrobiia bacterium]|nr:wax ester/triacylglycerol synthase family O-acyltransferase [Acidimicrobiia bacterium]